MGKLFLGVAFMAAFLLQVASPARAEIPGGGQPVALVMCRTQAAAELLAAQIVVRPPMIGGDCIGLTPPVFPSPELMAQSRLLLGPLADWEGDAFGVFEAASREGSMVYPLIWWGAQFSPIGLKI